MQSLESLLTGFRMPDLTPEEWREQNARAAEWDAEQKRIRREERISESMIPLGYREASGGDERVLKWAESPTKGLLLQGGVGRGKTHNACIALKVALDNGMTARFATFDDMLMDCRATFHGSDTEKSVISRYANVGMLCIDDMGKERVTEWSLPIIFSIINKRGMNERPTIITTQYTGQQLIERMTVNRDAETARAIISRLMEYTRVTIEGKDWRRAEQPQ